MKTYLHKTAVLVCICFAIFPGVIKAQGIFFPDNIFQQWVITHYPSCVFPDQSIDVTCSDIVNEDTLDLSGYTYAGLSITNFAGLQYFTSLRYLDISDYPGTDEIYLNSSSLPLPATLKVLKCRNFGNIGLGGGGNFSSLILPNGLEYLDIARAINSSYHSLPALPSSLKYLDFSSNSIQGALNVPPLLDTLICSKNGQYINSAFVVGVSSLSALPSTLKYLACNGNILTALPSLPAGLTYLDCSNNVQYYSGEGTTAQTGGITSIPALPASLKYLNCSDNIYIPSLPSLPAGLVFLGCAANNITSLPTLPSILQKLICKYNDLNSLPALPVTLDSLVCDGNNLVNLPSLPTGLRTLNVRYNHLSTLPALPDSLRSLDVVSNPELGCLPHLPAHLINLETFTIFDPAAIQCIPNYVNGLVSDITTLCTVTNNSNLCVSFPVLSGHVFYDNNSNGIKEASENYRANVGIQLSNGLETYSNTNGFYSITADTGVNTLTVAPPTYYNAVPATLNFSMPAFSSTLTQDIALQPNTIFDSVTVNVTPYGAARPGFDQWYSVDYENVGTTALSPATVFNYDNTRLSFVNASNPSVIDNGSSLTFTESNFTPGQHGGFVAQFNVKPTALAGDTIFVNVIANAGSITVTDSSFTRITASLDPNDKNSTPKLTPQQVSSGAYINYLVRFQNTGSDTAFNIVLTDTLDNKLDAASFEMTRTSHPCKVTRTGNTLSFEFLNILLPDMTTNELLSHGYIRFRVKAKTNVILGDVIPNKADIYFDFNSPVLTNTTNTLIDLTTLPLSLLSFKALTGSDNSALLFWNTADEVKTASFDIEQSVDGRIFTRVGNTAARGRGSNAYTFKTSIPADVVYYRLKMIDIDGRFSYSQVVEVRKNKAAESIVVLNNPATNTLSLINTDASLINTTANIFNQQGVLVQRFVLKDGLQTVDVSKLAAGVYYLKTGIASKKLLINH